MGLRELLPRLVVAALLGSLIGLDRQRLDKSAGLRTHMLVCVGSALFMIVSTHGFGDVLSPGRIVLDPSRVAAQVVSGIGFLGAGAILRRNQSVHGLTTAASIWSVAAVGLAAGGGLYYAAVSATALMLIILLAVKPLEHRLLGQDRRRALSIVASDKLTMAEIEARVRGAGFHVLGLKVRSARKAGERRLEITCTGANSSQLAMLVDGLKNVEGVHEVGVDDN